jgi:hypothetical protein
MDVGVTLDAGMGRILTAAGGGRTNTGTMDDASTHR